MLGNEKEAASKKKFPAVEFKESQSIEIESL
jgi:hypothetical protein